MLPSLLELIYESEERNLEHTIIVVDEPESGTLASVASNVKIIRFSEVEREGVRVQKILSPVPSELNSIVMP